MSEDRDKLYAWMRKHGFAVSNNASVDAMLDQLSARLIVPDAEQAPSIEDIVAAATDMLGVSADALRSSARNRAFTDARAYVALVAYRTDAGGYTLIARALRKDITTVMTMVDTMRKRAQRSPSIRAAIAELEWRAREIRELHDEQGGHHSVEPRGTRTRATLDSLGA